MTSSPPSDALAKLAVVADKSPDTTNRDSDYDEEPDFVQQPTPGDKSKRVLEQWVHIIDQVSLVTEDSFAGSPKDLDLTTPAGKSAFQSYWRGVLTDLEKKIMANDNIPEYVTSPPCEYFNIYLFRRNGVKCDDCPCFMPMPTPNIRVNNPDGVTKGDVIKAIGTYLYGSDDEMPTIFDEYPGGEYPGIYDDDDDDEEPEPELEKQPREQPRPRPEINIHEPLWGPDHMVLRYQFPALVYNFAWLNQGEYVYPEDMEKGGPIIWLHCCTPDEFKAKMEKWAEARKAAEEEQHENESDSEVAKL
ncbi:hypothetical protein V8F20_007114 [Naviculisporaceae sp. PSN 640]